MKDRFSFWQRWLWIVSLTITGFGIFMALLNRTTVFEIFNAQIDPIFWGEAGIPEAARQFQGWVYGVWGATVAGWGLLVALIARYPFRERQTWAWKAIVYSLLLWYVFDTGISLYFGVTFNAIFNTLLLILIAPPMIATKKNFQGS